MNRPPAQAPPLGRSHAAAPAHRRVLVTRRTRQTGQAATRVIAFLIATSAAVVSKPADAGGFYARAGVGLDHPAGAVFTDRDCSSASPAALYGCGLGPDGAPYHSRGGFGNVPALEAGLGFAASSIARLEAVLEYRPRLEFDGRANFLEPGRRQSIAADASSLSGMVMAYVDLAGPRLPNVGSLEFLVGAGAGVAHNRVGKTTMAFPRTTTVVPGGNRRGFAWTVTAGVAAALGARTTLELAWRYSDLGVLQTDRGAGRVTWRDGSREPLLLDLAVTRAKLNGHGLRLSLRYAL